MQRDRVRLNGKEVTINATAAAVEHLPQRDANLLRFLFCDGMPAGKCLELRDRFLESGIPADGCVR